MTKLPVVNGRECIEALQRVGFVINRQKGSHVTMIRDNPNHRKELRRDTLQQIIKDAGLTEFVVLLNE
jgi:predicted RNA binding protein YcfA (HicA-like mRNA interferase family)